MKSGRNLSHVLSLALGGMLVLAGYLLGSLGRPSPAHAQALTPGGAQSLVTNGRETVITQSADGLTLHVWSLGPAEELKPRNLPDYVGSIEAD